MKKILTLTVLLGIANVLWGQTTIVNQESFGASLGAFNSSSWVVSDPSPNNSTGYSGTPTASGTNSAAVSDDPYAENSYLSLTNSFSTSGKTSVTLKFSEWIDDPGFVTSDIGIEYSLNNGSLWIDAGFVSSAGLSTNNTVKSFAIPAIDNQTSVMIRFYTKQEGVGSGGAYYIDDFVVVGTSSIINFYNQSGQGLSTASTNIWSTNTNGIGGSGPSNFFDPNQIFNVINGSSVSTSNTWSVSGSGSKIVIGDGTNAVTLNATSNITGPVDINNQGYLKITASSNNPGVVIGTLATGSTVEYGKSGSGNQNIKTGAYYNLVVSGATTTKTLQSSTTVSGTFTASGGPIILGTNTLTLGTLSGTPTFNSSTGTLTINGVSGSPTLTFASPFGLNSLNINGSSSINLASSLVLTGSLSIASGASLSVGSNTITLGTGGLTVNGVLSGTPTIVGNSSAAIVYNSSGSSTLSFDPANKTIASLSVTSGTLNLSSDVIITGALSISSGATLNANGHKITLGTSATINGTLSGSPVLIGSTTAAIIFASSVPTTIYFDASGAILNSLTISSGTLTIGSDFTLGGTDPLISIASLGTLDAGTHQITRIIDSGNIEVFGTIKTAHLNGLNALPPSTATFIVPTASEVPLLKAGSTIEYTSTSTSPAQVITPFPEVSSYYNLILSGGVKNFTGDNSISNNLTVSSGASVTALSGSIVKFVGTTQSIDGCTFQEVRFSGNGTKTLNTPSTVLKLVTLYGGATVAAGSGNLILASTANNQAASLMMDATASGSVTGNVVTQRFVTGRGSNAANPSGFPVLLSSPVSTNLSGFQATDANFYWYNNAATPSKWVKVNVNAPATAGMGYFLRVKDTKVFSLTGTVNNGPITRTLSASGDQFNLIGNPYPSSLLWSTTGITFTGANTSIVVHNAGSNSYSPITISQGIRLPAFQGFFIQTSGAGTHEIGFTNAARSEVDGTLNREMATYDNELRIKVKRNKLYDDVIVMAKEGAHFGVYDDAFDLGKFAPGSEVPAIYFTKSDKPLSIYAFGSDEARASIPLKFVLPIDTTYLLDFENIEKVDPMYSIYLVDSALNVIKDLRSLDPTYSFTATAASSAKNRFSIVFSESIVTSLNGDASLDQKISVFSEAGTAQISTDMLADGLYISDISGKKVYESSSISSKSMSIDLSASPQGVYIATIATEGRLIHKKFILNK